MCTENSSQFSGKPNLLSAWPVGLKSTSTKHVCLILRKSIFESLSWKVAGYEFQYGMKMFKVAFSLLSDNNQSTFMTLDLHNWEFSIYRRISTMLLCPIKRCPL